MSRPARAATGASSSKLQQDPEPRSCIGLLYYSQFRHEFGKAPACAGFKRRHPPGATIEGSSDAVPAGDFKYLCLGYSAYDEASLRNAARQSKPGDAVNVPYCEGIELIAAAAAQHDHRLMTEAPGSGVSSIGNEAAPQHARRPQNRSYVPGMQNEPDTDLHDLLRRMQGQSDKIIARMKKNANLMADFAKQQWDRIVGGR